MTAWEAFVEDFVTYGAYNTVIDGLIRTLYIAFGGLAIGIVIGTLIAVVKVVPSKNKFVGVLRKLCDIYVALFRGIPMVVQLLLFYFVIFAGTIPNIPTAILAFGMNSGAYVSEIMRGGIQSVDPGQLEAGRSLGLSYGRTMWNVVLPQSLKNILPTMGNELIALVKETSVLSFIAVVDLTTAFKFIADANYEYIIPYCMLALFYLVIVLIFTLLIRLLEKRMKKNERTH